MSKSISNVIITLWCCNIFYFQNFHRIWFVKLDEFTYSDFFKLFGIIYDLRHRNLAFSFNLKDSVINSQYLAKTLMASGLVLILTEMIDHLWYIKYTLDNINISCLITNIFYELSFRSACTTRKDNVPAIKLKIPRKPEL